MDNFGKFFSPPYALDLTKRERVETWYRNARYVIMASILFTVLCTALSLMNPHPFLFALTIPHALILWGYLSSGMASAGLLEAYAQSEFAIAPMENLPFSTALIAALFVLLLYIVCWFRSKDYHAGWLIAALIFTLADTAAMLVINGFHPVGIVFHGGVIAFLIIGIVSHFRLKKMPLDNPHFIPLDELK